MKKKLFDYMCLPLLNIHNTVYTFLSGIFISLSTNIFTTICIDDIEFINQWNLYISSLFFAILSGLLLYMATKMTGFQTYVIQHVDSISSKSKKNILIDATYNDYNKWLIRYCLLFSLLILGTIFLATNFSWLFNNS